MTGPILVTGATGTVGRRVVAALGRRGAEVRSGTRHPEKAGSVRFDWQAAETFAAFRGVEAMLVVAPRGAEDALAIMRPGLERALEAGVRRFVLVGASSIERDGPFTGGVYRWLSQHGPEWTILRPSWFMQNVSEGQHLAALRDERAIYSATGTGRVPFIDTDDIAEVAAAVLTAPEHVASELLLTGPEALSYDEVAVRLSAAIGEMVTHHALTPSAMTRRFVDAGLPACFAKTLAAMDAAIAAGAEDRVTDVVRQITGRPPGSFEAYAHAHASTWTRRSSTRPEGGSA